MIVSEEHKADLIKLTKKCAHSLINNNYCSVCLRICIIGRPKK